MRTRTLQTAALALLAGCAGAPEVARPPPSSAEDLVAISRAMSGIEAAELGGQIASERARRSADAAARPADPVARFLAVSTLPRDEESWSAFRALADGHPESPWGRIGMVEIYLAWGNTLDQASAEAARALEVAPGNWIAVLLRGEVAERREDAAAARADFATVLRADPKNPRAHLGIARLLRRQGDAEGAFKEAQAALEATPDNHDALALLGAVAVDRGDKRAAAGYLEQAVALAPRNQPERLTLAALQRELGNSAAAVEQLRAAIAIREDPAAVKALVELTHAGGDAPGELKATERLVKLEPGPAATWRRLGELRLAMQDLEGAETALDKALDREPRSAETHLLLARVHEARGDTAGALAELRASGDAGAARRTALERQLNVEKLSGKDLNALQRAVEQRVSRTYQQRLADTPSLSGTLRLRVAVDDGGKAGVVDVLEDSVHDAFVRACAYWNLKDASYPKRKGTPIFTFALRRGR